VTEIPVSVIICTYNRGKYLARCLESIKKQTYSNYEIIVVNGPSTDNTDTILQRYDDIKIISQKTLNGLSYARNLGIVSSNGDIIAFIDDDAVADEKWLQNLVLGYSDDSVGGVGGPVYEITGHWYQFKNGYISRSGIPVFINDKDLQYNDPKGRYLNYIMGTNSSFKKSILVKIGFFDEKYRYYLDETDVCVRVIQAGYKIKHSDNPIVFHEMVEGHNRNDHYIINYSEILKNNVYFILKNFNHDYKSYTIFPLFVIGHWIKIDYSHFFSGKVTLNEFIRILIKIIFGGINGYIQGLNYIIKIQRC